MPASSTSARSRDFPAEKWDAIIALNLVRRLPHDPRRLRGHEGARLRPDHQCRLGPRPGRLALQGAYVAAKHGVIGLTKTVALEGAELGVTCNAICPGYVWTPLVENQIDDPAKARGISRDEVIRDVLLAAQPNKRFATVEEIGALAVFLCSDAAQSITGTALPVDGGWTAH